MLTIFSPIYHHPSEVSKAVGRLSGDMAARIMERNRRDWLDSTAEHAVKRMRLEEPTEKKLKKPGLRNQHASCTAVLAAVEDAMVALNDGDEERLRKHLTEGKELLLHRIKLLKIADREGWGVVQKYEQDPLADDEADEKRLKKAIKSASSSKKTALSSNRGREGRQPSKFQNRRSYSSKGKRCYNCDSRFHMVKNCPKARSERSKRRGADYVNKILDK